MSTKKKQRKLGSFFNKLNPNSPAKKLLAFVLVFAVLGGGYYAYRSFANTNMVIVNASQMTGGTPIYTTVNNKQVMVERRLTSGVSFSINLSSNSKYKVCVNARDIHGETDVARYSHGTSGTGALTNFKLKSGWVAPWGNSQFSGGSLGVGLSGKDGATNKTIAIRQVAYIKNGGACPQ